MDYVSTEILSMTFINLDKKGYVGHVTEILDLVHTSYVSPIFCITAKLSTRLCNTQVSEGNS